MRRLPPPMRERRRGLLDRLWGPQLEIAHGVVGRRSKETGPPLECSPLMTRTASAKSIHALGPVGSKGMPGLLVVGAQNTRCPGRIRGGRRLTRPGWRSPWPGPRGGGSRWRGRRRPPGWRRLVSQRRDGRELGAVQVVVDPDGGVPERHASACPTDTPATARNRSETRKRHGPRPGACSSTFRFQWPRPWSILHPALRSVRPGSKR